jgi:dUTP pyrophosphatase
MIELGIKKLNESVNVPSFSTRYSACFDLEANFHTDTINIIDEDESKGIIPVLCGSKIVIPPKKTAMIPTGIIFIIPTDMCMKIYSRSSLAWKKNLVVANGVGVIDSDYQQETFVLLKNHSKVNQIINTHDRIAQAELIKIADKSIINFYVSEELPVLDSDRNGGFGSTGK